MTFFLLFGIFFAVLALVFFIADQFFESDEDWE